MNEEKSNLPDLEHNSIPKKGRPKGSKRKAIRTTKALRAARALLDCTSNKAAYMKLYPKSKPFSAACNSSRLITPEVIEIMQEMLQSEKLVDITKENLIRLFTIVIAKYMSGKESGANFIRALENLKQLVPDFVDRRMVKEVSSMSESDIDKELEALGVKPDAFKRFESLGLSQGESLSANN